MRAFSSVSFPIPSRAANPGIQNIPSPSQKRGIADFSLWYTDTSHRCRHGISRVFTYRNCTTASAIFDIGSTVLIGQVATTLSARGRGYAREFLRWLAKFFNGLGKRAYLLALDVRVSFYEEIGFKIAGREIVLERVDVEKDSASKGMLEEK